VEALFKKEQQSREAQATADYHAELHAMREKTARLRALRLARDAARQGGRPADQKDALQSSQVAAVPPRSAITSRRLIIRGSRSSQAMQTRATAVGSTSESRLLPVGQRGARLPALPCDDKGKGDGDESFNQAAAVCFRAHHQRRGVRHHDRDPAPRIEVMHGYSAVLVLAVFGMGEVVHRPAALVPVVDARASSNIIKSANEPHERICR
jgi:hypothetical protein